MNNSKLMEAIRLKESERDFEGAIALLKDLICQDPTCVEALVHLAADSGILGRFPQAEQYARRALNIDPSSGQARYYFACALRDQGRLDEAYTEMEQALVLVRRVAAKGTVAEAVGIGLPLIGWARNVEQDAMNLRMRILVRNIRRKFLPVKFQEPDPKILFFFSVLYFILGDIGLWMGLVAFKTTWVIVLFSLVPAYSVSVNGPSVGIPKKMSVWIAIALFLSFIVVLFLKG